MEVRNFIVNGKTSWKYKDIIASNLVGNETMEKQRWKAFSYGLGKMSRIRNHIHCIRIVGNFIPFMKQLWNDSGEKVSFSSDSGDRFYLPWEVMSELQITILRNLCYIHLIIDEQTMEKNYRKSGFVIEFAIIINCHFTRYFQQHEI